MRFSRQEYWSGLPFPIQRIFWTQELSPCLFTSPGLQVDSLSPAPLGKHTFVFVQSLSHVWLFVTPWSAARQASLSFTISQNCSDSCPLSWRCHPTILPSVTCFSSCPQSFPPSGTFPVSRLFASGGQSIEASAPVHPVNIQSWFPLGLTGLILLSE